MQLKKPLLAILCVGPLVVLTGCSSSPDVTKKAEGQTVVYQPDYPQYESLEQLFKTADVVVEGRVRPSKSTLESFRSRAPVDSALAAGIAKTPDEAIVYTVSEIEITKVWKGKVAEGSVLKVKQLGGESAGVNHREEGAPLLEPETSRLLFLATYPDSPASLLNPQQGQYSISDKGSFASVAENGVVVSSAALSTLASSK